MATKPPVNSMDERILSMLRAGESMLRERDEAQAAEALGVDPNASPMPRGALDAGLLAAQAIQDQLSAQSRGLPEHAQDAATGLMGTFGAIGNTAVLGVAAAGDALGNLTGTHEGWDATQDALGQLQDTSEYWNSLQSEKSKAFDRLNQYRQDRAVKQTNLEAMQQTGDLASPIDRMLAEAGAAVGSYAMNPDQILTDGISQLPYLLTGGVAKGVTSGTKLANPLINRMVARGMTKESAEKLVQMGLVGGLQGSIEGADAASGAYSRVMASQNTFAAGEEAARESAALEAAAKAFGIAGLTGAVTGTLASKFELSPFSAMGGNAVARTGDNLIKALQEGFQETIESGVSQFATNYAGNTVLNPGDDVMLDQGVGGAAGTGLVVGMGSTVITNPRSVVDAAMTPVALAGKGFGYVGKQAAEKERQEDVAATVERAQKLSASITSPAATAVLNQTPEQTVDTDPELIALPDEIDLTNPVGRFLTGMEYLKGKDHESEDAVMAFHVLGSTLAAVPEVMRLRDALEQDLRAEGISTEEQMDIKGALEEVKSAINEADLAKWVAEFPVDQIEARLNEIKENPESFGSTIARMARIDPLKLPVSMLETALEAKQLPQDLRNALTLSKELQQAQLDLEVSTGPNASEVSRSIMQTGFPGASSKMQSVADMLRSVTGAIEQGEPDIAQSHFNKLVSFSNYLTNRSGRFAQALKDMNADPSMKMIDVPGTKTWVDGKLTATPFRLVQGNANSLGNIPAIRKDAEMVAKMVSAIQKRTGLVVGGALTDQQQDPLEVAEKPQEAAPVQKAPDAAPKVEKAPAAPVAAPVATEEDAELASLTDEALAQEIDSLIGSISRRRNNDTAKAVEQDIRYNNLVREQARRFQAAPKAVDKPVQKPAAAQAEPVAATVDIAFDEVTAEVAEATEEPAATEAVAEVGSEPSKNHYTDLMPSYPVAEDATVAEQSDAKNHLTQSFTMSEQEGLVSKLPETADALIQELQLRDEDAGIAAKLFELKDKLVSRLNEGLSKSISKDKARKMADGSLRLWHQADKHSLYATRFDGEGNIAYDPTIAEVMAWTAIQHALDLVQPVKWSTDKEAAFVQSYGEAILPKLADGWVPLAEQVHQVAQKLQRNLELVPDNSVSLEYTEGTMLALAMDALSTIMGPGRLLASEQIQLANDGALVQWVNLQTDPDLWHDAARAMEGFFPERSSAAAGIVAEKPTQVNPMYRGSRQKVGKQQKKALLDMSQTAHKISPLMLGLWGAVPEELFERLSGVKPLEGKPVTLAEIARNGANKTIKSDIKTIKAHIRAVLKHAEDNDVEVTSVESFFEYEMAVNGRAMTKGTSPQSSKIYRELFSTVQESVDPSQNNDGFLMAVAQGLGVKMDKQPVKDSLDQLSRWLAQPSVKAALEAADRLAHNDLSQMDADVDALMSMVDDQGKAIELTEHGLTALVHMAEYQKGQPFVSSLSYEIDGLTDGPINLMMLLGLQGGVAEMEHWLGLGGLWFGKAKVAVQDQLEVLKDWFGGSKDLYEIIANKASEQNNKQAEKVLKSLDSRDRDAAKGLMQAILHLMHITKLSQSDLHALMAKHSRSFTKKPTQAAGYLQGEGSIVNDLANTMLEALSERIDAEQMTDMDWRAVDALFSRKLVFSKKHDRYMLFKNPKEFEGLEWAGEPLNATQFKALTQTLRSYGGFGLANATMGVIGFQRMHMSDAMELVNQHIRYAQKVIQDTYKARQEIEVEAGRLHPGQALSKQDEQAITNEVWKRLIPHPMLRHTAGLPTSSLGRGGVPTQDVRRVQSLLFQRDKANPTRTQNLQVSEASLDDPGVSFAALSIMASGDGAMMAGFHADNATQGENRVNALNMYDGTYISPSQIARVGESINKEVKQNWEFDYIGAVLDSLKMDDAGFKTWAEAQGDADSSLYAELQGMVTNLKAQQMQQKAVMSDINSRDHSVSHMAGHNNPFWQAGTPLNSTTLGTSQTDPLLDLAADSLGHVANGIRKMGKAEVSALLNEHTFENPVLSGLWKVLAPLVSDNLTLFMSSDKQAMAEFYAASERREMGAAVDGVSIGDRVYVRAVNAETILHELLHATTKNLTATYFAKPAALTAQQREAMQNLLALMEQFMAMDPSELPMHQQAMVEHVQAVMRGLDTNSALQEFLAYGLSNYHLQRTLGTTKSTLGQLMESIFNAVKKLFGFKEGTQSDSMLAQMFSNFSTLTEGAANVIYPVSVEEALNAVNPELARSYSAVFAQLEQRSATVNRSLKARNDARTRMQELADTGLFNLTDEQQTAAEYVQAMFAAGLQFKPDVNAVLQRVVDALKDSDVLDPEQHAFFFDNIASKHDRAADIMSLALVNPEFAERLDKVLLTRPGIKKDSLDNWLDTSAKALFDWFDTGLSIKKDASLSDALEVVGLRLRKSMLASVKRQQTKPGMYRKVTQKLTEGVQMVGDKAGKMAEDRQSKLEAGQKDRTAVFLNVVAGMTNDNYADTLGNLVLSMSNELDKANPLREVIQEMVGTVGDNYKLIKLKGIAARMISAVRQSFREQVPALVKGWFTELTEEQDTLMHTVIGKMAVYSLSQGMKDRMVELLTDPTNALLDTQTLLMGSGNRTKRALMVKYAKHLGDQMANKGTLALYRNTPAIAGLAVNGGGERLSEAEMAALEDLSTLQALTHLTPVQRRMMTDLVRNQPDAFWKTTALIHSFQKLDTERAGKQTATLNFQKGWIPVEADGRKKVKLFLKSEVKKAERLGWVQVGEFATEPNMVYMATTVGKTPTLSGGAIHAVDMHMNGIHYQSGLPTDPSIQTMITHPKYMAEIKDRISKGEIMPYTALYDAAGDVVGFQRILDPAVVERHTREIRRISDAAGIWLGRLHEERTAHGLNQQAAILLAQTWDQAKTDKREKEFVDIRNTKDKVLNNVWSTLPYHTKVQLETAFADGSKNPPIWIRRDQLNDAVGYHKAGVANFFTGDNRYEKQTNTAVAALSRQFIGKDAYKYLVMAEEGWQGLIANAKDTIIVKSLVVALNNLASNQTQLFMITGNPVWNIRVQSQKHKEVVSYLGYQQRVARLTAEGLATTDQKVKQRIDVEQAQLKLAMRKLSIYPLIEAGEMPTIAEGLSETDEFSLVGDFTAWAEGQLGKMPPMVGTVVNNLAVTKDTSLYKGLDRLVQYGDFVAKAAMYEWLTTQKGKSHDEALMEVNDEFVNYARLPGRWRTYGEDMGLLWFYNYKLRIMKIAFRRMRQNPAAFLIGVTTGGMLGIDTLLGNVPGAANFAYTTGIDPLFDAHQSILWNQLF